MTPSTTQTMTRAEKLDLYLRLPEPDTRRVNERADYTSIEDALTEAGRLRRASSATVTQAVWRFRKPSRKVMMIAAALAILLILAIACVCTGFLSRALNFSKKTSMNTVTLPNGVTKKKEEPAPTEPQAMNVKIVFLLNQDQLADGPTNIGDIYTIRLDGSDQRQLTGNGQNYAIALSPDGSKIAYARDLSIWLMNSDGSENREIVAGNPYDDSGIGGYSGPEWSPDGLKLVFCTEERLPSLSVYNMATGELSARFFNDGAFRYGWLPDSTRIFYADAHSERLMVMDADGSNRQELFASPDYYAELSFSPAGNRFVVTRSAYRTSPKSDALLGSFPGMGLEVIESGQQPGDYYNMRWLPDGKNIINAVGWADASTAEFEVINAETKEKWPLFSFTNRPNVKLQSHPSAHTGTPYIGLFDGNIYRIDMNGEITRLTDSGQITELDWR
jgi:Tol biopolymer transport system component